MGRTLTHTQAQTQAYIHTYRYTHIHTTYTHIHTTSLLTATDNNNKNQHNDNGHCNNSSNHCPCYYEDIAAFTWKFANKYVHNHYECMKLYKICSTTNRLMFYQYIKPD